MSTNTSSNPYVGPRPFQRQDSHRFFGRDQEANELLSLIVANRAVLLYAQSGAGKTSLLDAQVSALLEKEGFNVMPTARVQGPALEGIEQTSIPNLHTFYTLLTWQEQTADPQTLLPQTIPSYLSQLPSRLDEYGDRIPRVLIFDQFEELFTAYPGRWQDREAFFQQINHALQADSLLRVVFSMREDYIAQLDPYADLLPKGLRARFRLERMRPGPALDAVKKPLLNTPRHFAPGVAEQLVEDLRKVRVETAVGTASTVIGEFIEPVQLQVVCQNLWQDLPADVTTITHEHLQRFGDVNQALSRFYERGIQQTAQLPQIAEKPLREWFENTLITPAGTRGTVYRGRVETGGVQNTAVEQLENLHLIRGEWRAGARWYELTHDRLIEPIQQSNRAWDDRRRERRNQRLRQGFITAIAFLAVGFVLLTAIAFVTNQLENVSATASAASREAELALAAQVTADFRAASTSTIAAQLAGATTTAEVLLIQATNDSLSTSEAAAIATSNARATEQVIAEATSQARATAEANALATAQTVVEKRGLVRPLRPGISVGGVAARTGGTLSAFVRDAAGNNYLLTIATILGQTDAPVLQPGPVDGGQVAQDTIATTTNGLSNLADTAQLSAAELVGMARLGDEPFEVTIPNLGPLLGVHPVSTGQAVYFIGRTSGIKTGIVTALDVSQELPITLADGSSSEVLVTGGFTLSNESGDPVVAPGDEGALVVDQEGYAVGVVVASGADNTAVVAPMQDILDNLQTTLITRSEVASLEHDGAQVWSVAISPDSHYIASGDNTGTVRLWDFNNLQADPILLTGHESGIRALAFHPNSQLLASGDNLSVLQLWDTTQPGTVLARRTDHGDSIRSLNFSPDGNYLLSGSWDGYAGLWEVADQSQTLNFLTFTPLENGQIWSTAFTSRSGTFAAGYNDGTIYSWLSYGLFPTPTDSFTPHTAGVLSLAYNPETDLLVSGGADNKLFAHLLTNLNDTVTTSELIYTHPDLVWSVAFSSDGQLLASGCADGLVRLWNITNLSADPIVLSPENPQRVWSIAFSPDGRFLLSASDDGTVRIWQIKW